MVLTVSFSSDTVEKVKKKIKIKKARGLKRKVKISDNPPEGTETGAEDTAVFCRG